MKSIKNHPLYLLLLGLLISYNLSGQSYECSTSVEIRYGLIILPVVIEGTTYDFLFDTGAPTSISKELQDQHQFQIQKTKKQTDSDGTSKKIDYVKIETFQLAGLNFNNHLASVHDYKVNPAIACLEIDGIIGSNSMHLSTWQIDYREKILTITDRQIEYIAETDIRYKSDQQKTIFINLKTPHSTLKNLKVDYGSVGGLSVPENIFNVLQERNEFSKILETTGYKMSGLFGKKKKKTIYSGIITNTFIGQVALDSFMIKTGSKGLLGVQVLQDFFVTIDGRNKILRLQRYDAWISDEFSSYGIGLGYDKGKIVVMNVLQGSEAEKYGVFPGAELKSFGSIVLNDQNSLCHYMFSKNNLEKEVNMVFVDQEGNEKTILIKKINYYH